MYKLLIEDDEGGKTAVSLIRDEITIGRKEGNTIRLTERNVSRRHGRILRQEDRVFIENVAARYGIKKNGQKIEGRVELAEGDVVLIGDYRLTLQADAKAKLKKGGAAKPHKPAARAPGRVDPREATQITSLAELSEDFADDDRENTQIMQAMPAKLVVISSNFAGEEFPLHQEEMVIGRGDDCHIIIDHRSISTKHAKIVREDHTTYKIVDLNSKNGVKVSGDTYRATHLKRGDVVELGHVKFRFVEPGENYVFTPRSAATEAAAVPVPVAAAGNDKKLVIILGAALVASLLVGAILFMGDDPGEVTSSGDAASAGRTQGQLELDQLEASNGADRFEAGIARAQELIEEGRLERAMGTLEALGNSPEHQVRIDEKMASARAELPFKRSYESVFESLDDGDHREALERVAQIPSHSIFHARLQKDGIFEEIFGGVLDLGRDALEDGEYNEAQARAEDVLLVRDDHAAARKLLSDIEAKKEEARVIAARREEEARARQQASNSSARSSRTQQPRVSAAEANALFTSAARKVASGDSQGAIDDCTQAVRSGNSNCHRILGLAYAQQGNNGQACQHLERYLATGPNNAAAIESQMDRLGCGQ